MAGLFKSCDEEGQWRYLVMGKACFHLDLIEDVMVLLQKGRKRIIGDALRRKSIYWSDDNFFLSAITSSGDATDQTLYTPTKTPIIEFEGIAQLLSHIKLLIRRSCTLAALDAGLYSKAICYGPKSRPIKSRPIS
ncbi:hypothetical protein K1719_043942 [Acacia pycnantha]|nr:hypothetical protein K1719_043942 [Acacia pycnantha]